MKRKITIIFMLILFMILVPTIVRGYDFYCKSNDGCYVGKHKSLGGIYHQMRKNGHKWLSSTPSISGGWECEACPAVPGNTITERGGICFGHATSNRGDGLAKVRYVLDMDENNKNYNQQLLAYAIFKSTEKNEGPSYATYKSQIRQWLYDFYPGIIQSSDQNAKSDYKTTGAKKYANMIKNACLSTTSTESERATQSIRYDGTYTFIGPYNLKMKGGTLSKATIETREGAKIDTEWCSKNGTRAIKLNTINNYNGNSFYIVYKGQIDSVKKIVLNKTMDVISARIVLTEPQHNGGQNIGIFYGEKTDKDVSLKLPGVPFSTITVTKIDTDTRKAMSGIGFIVYCEGKGYVVEGTPAKYVADKTKATVYYTSANGKREIKNLSSKGKYTIYEVVNPYFGFKEVSLNEPLQVGEANITAIGQVISLEAKNKREYVRISGYVWEDIPVNKNSMPNYLWNSADKDERLRNVKVTLKKADGTVIQEVMTKTIKNSKNEDEKGAYILGDYFRDKSAPKIRIEDLRDAYIEFEYNGMCYKSIEVKASAVNGNKATDTKYRTDNKFNDNFAAIVQGASLNGNNNEVYKMKYDYSGHKAIANYEGQYLYGYDNNKYAGSPDYDKKKQKYPISGVDSKYLVKANTKDASPSNLLGQSSITITNIYDQGLEEIPNVNLGLLERDMPDITLVQDVESAKISLNNYEHTYYYSDRFNKLNEEIAKDSFDEGVGVNFGEKYGPEEYSTTVYSSDIVYKADDPDGNLSVHIIYKICLRNQSNKLYTTVNQLYNYFDKEYTIEAVKDENGNSIVWQNDSNYGDSQYERALIKANQKLEPNSQKYLEIEYSLSDNAIVSLLNGEKRLDSITEVASYSSYEDKNFSKRYAGIDIDSEPNNSKIGDKSTYEDDIDAAPSLILKGDKTRTIKGTVFEDNAIEELLEKEGYEKQRIGDGQYNKDVENVIANVQVDLMNVNEKGEATTVANIYQYKNGKRIIVNSSRQDTGEKENVKYGGTYTITNEPIATDENGNYEIEGVIPGNYVIRYTYRDKSVLRDIKNGTEKELNEEGGVENYKSTIFRSKRNNNGFIDTSAAKFNDKNWYVKESATKSTSRLSDAKDDKELVKQRTTVIDDINFVKASEISTIEEVYADTKVLEIRLDCNEDDLTNITKYDQQLKLKFVFDQVDFGIIRRPKQSLEVTKEISYVEVTLANGQVLISGDPRQGNIPNLKSLPGQGIHLEIDTEILQGSTLKLEYEITVNNQNCEIDYNDENYYYYGTVPENNKDWKIATVTDMFDYPDETLSFNQENQDDQTTWEYVDIKQDLLNNGTLSPEAYAAIVKKYNKILRTEKFANMKPGEKVSVKMAVAKLLSSNEENLTFDNSVEVNKLKYSKADNSIPGNYDPVNHAPNEPDDDTKETVITTPTGEDKGYLEYIIVGVVGLIILTTGIILLKKKVIK